MGMTLTLFAVGERDIDVLRSNPPLAWKLLALDDPEWSAGMIADAGVPADVAARFDPQEDGVAETDLDKAWHGIHYLLTGSAWEGEPPLNFLLHGGELLGDEEDEEPPPRALGADEVQEIVRALATVDEAQLRARFDPQAMQALQIYPDVWDRGEEELDYVLHYFAELQTFVADAAQRRCGLVIFIG